MAQSSQTRSARLDALPFTRLHGRLLGASGVGWAMDAMDVGLISFILVALPANWDLKATFLGITAGSWLACAGFVGMAIGASMGGWLADRIGRRQVFALTMVLYGLATGASALAMGITALIILRLIVGLGLGAELPVASTLVSEFSPPRIRGRMIVWLEAFWAVGWTGAALLGYFVASPDGVFGSLGWRVALAFGALPALYAVVVRRTLPESVRFLEAQGQYGQAEQVVARFEAVANVKTAPAQEPVTSRGGDSELDGKPSPVDPAREYDPVRVPISELFRGGLARRTAAIWTVWFCVNFSYYGAFIWLPTILNQDLGSITKSFQYTLIITLAQLPGYAMAAFLIEKWCRRATLATYLVGSAAAAALFAQVNTTAGIIAAGMTLSFFNLGAWGALYAVTPEVYPTVLRGTGAGWAAGFGRVASVLAVLISPLVFTRVGTGWVFTIFACSFAIGAVAAFMLPEMRAKVLESTLEDTRTT
ncbi:MAG: MFS transporter [Micrococcales bacterium]|nr:MFS transporter [Micrococcales bacterium]